MIIISNLGTEITNVLVDRAIFVSMISEVVVEIIVIINLGLLLNNWSSAFAYRCRCLQNVITVMDISDAQLSSSKLLWRQVC
jgi:hypothetical protein